MPKIIISEFQISPFFNTRMILWHQKLVFILLAVYSFTKITFGYQKLLVFEKTVCTANFLRNHFEIGSRSWRSCLVVFISKAKDNTHYRKGIIRVHCSVENALIYFLGVGGAFNNVKSVVGFTGTWVLIELIEQTYAFGECNNIQYETQNCE